MCEYWINKYVLYKTSFESGLTILLPAFQLGPRKKQADASFRPTACPLRLPSIILEVGDSESLAQLKIDAKLWLELMPEVSQFLPLLLLTHWNFFRCNLSSFF